MYVCVNSLTPPPITIWKDGATMIKTELQILFSLAYIVHRLLTCDRCEAYFPGVSLVLYYTRYLIVLTRLSFDSASRHPYWVIHANDEIKSSCKGNKEHCDAAATAPLPDLEAKRRDLKGMRALHVNWNASLASFQHRITVQPCLFVLPPSSARCTKLAVERSTRSVWLEVLLCSGTPI